MLGIVLESVIMMAKRDKLQGYGSDGKGVFCVSRICVARRGHAGLPASHWANKTSGRTWVVRLQRRDTRSYLAGGRSAFSDQSKLRHQRLQGLPCPMVRATLSET